MAIELKDLTKRADNYSQWYNDLVIKADLAEQSAVRGCMVIKPYGYAIWEKMQHNLDQMFKETGVQNAYFPLLIPKSFLSREADHVQIAPVDKHQVTGLRKGSLADVSASERIFCFLEANALSLVVDARAGADTEDKTYLFLSFWSDLIFNVAYGAGEDIETVKQKGRCKCKLNLCKLIFEGVDSAERSYLHAGLIYAGFNYLSVIVEGGHTVKAVIDVYSRENGARSARPMLRRTAVEGVVAGPDRKEWVNGYKRRSRRSESFHVYKFLSGDYYFE